MNSRSALLTLSIAAVLAPASAMGMASAELYTTSSYLYGRFDARVQFAPGDGVVSSFFLWKNGSATNTYWNELDYEKIDADCHMQLNDVYGEPSVQHQSTPTFNFDLCGGYHDYRFEWTPTYISWVVDGQEIRRDTGAAATAFAQNAAAGMTIHFNLWPGNSNFGGNINNTTLPVHQYISLVEYSSYDTDSGTFSLQWSQDFQSSDLPPAGRLATGPRLTTYPLTTRRMSRSQTGLRCSRSRLIAQLATQVRRPLTTGQEKSWAPTVGQQASRSRREALRVLRVLPVPATVLPVPAPSCHSEEGKPQD